MGEDCFRPGIGAQIQMCQPSKLPHPMPVPAHLSYNRTSAFRDCCVADGAGPKRSWAVYLRHFGADVYQVVSQRVWLLACSGYTLYVAVLGVYAFWWVACWVGKLSVRAWPFGCCLHVWTARPWPSTAQPQSY